SLPSFEDTKAQVQAAMAEITAGAQTLVPSITWQTFHEGSSGNCDRPYEQTNGRDYFFSRPGRRASSDLRGGLAQDPPNDTGFGRQDRCYRHPGDEKPAGKPRRLVIRPRGNIHQGRLSGQPRGLELHRLPTASVNQRPTDYTSGCPAAAPACSLYFS